MEYENKAKISRFNTILIAICSFVGVGFITGAEIWFYFARFGAGAFIGLLIFGVLIYLILFLSICKNRNKNSKLEKFKTKILIVGELAVASAMVSGLFETTRTVFEKWWIVVFCLAIFVMCLLFFLEKKSYLIYNYILAIFIIFVIVQLFVFNNQINTKNQLNLHQNFDVENVVLAGVFSCIYVFSNVAELRPVLEDNTKNLTKKQKRNLCLILALLLIILAFTLVIQFFINDKLSKFSMPFLELFKTHGGVSLFVFLAGLVMTMISTADACLIGVKNKIKNLKNNENFVKIIVIIISLNLGQIPFKIFIKIIYPIVAVLNFLIFLIEIFDGRKLRKI